VVQGWRALAELVALMEALMAVATARSAVRLAKAARTAKVASVPPHREPSQLRLEVKS
jgi:hypothetical protein